MSITYKQLKMYLDSLSVEQLDCDLTVEHDDECYAADFRISDENHASLDEDHPLIFIPIDMPRATDDEVREHILRQLE